MTSTHKKLAVATNEVKYQQDVPDHKLVYPKLTTRRLYKAVIYETSTFNKLETKIAMLDIA